MVAGARHTLTESTSNIDGAEASGTLRTRNCSVCVPGVPIVCVLRTQSVVTYDPSSRSYALKSVVTAVLPDDVSVTSAWSSATEASSMPTQRTSNETAVASTECTVSDSVV